MIELEKAEKKAQRLVEGFTLVSVRENDKVWLFEYKYYPDEAGADGMDVVVDKRTGEAKYVDIYTEDGYRLFSASKPVE